MSTPKNTKITDSRAQNLLSNMSEDFMAQLENMMAQVRATNLNKTNITDISNDNDEESEEIPDGSGEVEMLTRMRMYRGIPQVRIRWKGLDSTNDEWVNVNETSGCDEMILKKFATDTSMWLKSRYFHIISHSFNFDTGLVTYKTGIRGFDKLSINATFDQLITSGNKSLVMNYHKKHQSLMPGNIMYIYCRVSSQEQTDDNHISLEAQAEVMRDFCKKNVHNVTPVIINEVQSARDGTKQSVLNSLMDIMTPGDTLMVHDATRFSRNVIWGLNTLESLTRRGINFRSYQEGLGYSTDNDRRFFRQALNSSEDYSNMVSNRVKMSQKKIRETNGPVRSRGFGWGIATVNDIRREVENKSEQRVLTVIREMYQSGNSTYDDILDHLIDNNIPHRRRKWTTGLIRRAINNMGLNAPTERRQFEQIRNGRQKRNHMGEDTEASQPSSNKRSRTIDMEL